jgi:hypothetical protein
MFFFTLGDVSDKIHTKYFLRLFKEYKKEEPCQIGLVQLHIIQLKQRALKSNNLNMFHPEAFSQSYQHTMPILMAGIIMTMKK